MRLMILSKYLMQLGIRLIAVSAARFLSHFDTAERHKCTFERLVCLKTYDLFKVFHIFIDITGFVCGKSGYNVCIHIQNAAFGAFLFLKLLQLAPKLVCGVRRTL